MKQQGNRKFWKDKAIKTHSYWIRQRDTDGYWGYGNCITCGKMVHWKEADTGHFMSRRHEATFFDERNAHLQCKACNQWGSGLQWKHGKAIDKLYGEGTAEQLETKSKIECKRGWIDYYIIAKEFHDKLTDAGLELPPGTKTLFK